MTKNNILGKIYEGRWKVIGYYNKIYRLKNIFNGNEIEIYESGIRRIEKGATTVSKIICCRANRSKAKKTFKDITQIRQKQFAYLMNRKRGGL